MHVYGLWIFGLYTMSILRECAYILQVYDICL